jgi:quercetin dioxygenase-like cupin family protein
MHVHVVKSDDGETAERTGAAIFEGGQVWGRPLSAGLTEDTNVSVVHFAPGARAGWHTHTRDQVLYVVAGIGKVGDREGERVVSVGDCAVVPAGLEHWHGAHDTGSPMSHLSIMPVGAETSVLEE